jgi:hypothetical protein
LKNNEAIKLILEETKKFLNHGNLVQVNHNLDYIKSIIDHPNDENHEYHDSDFKSK